MLSLMRRPASIDLRDIAELLGLVREIIGIDADAVATHQARAEIQEVPFGARRREYLGRVDADAGKDRPTVRSSSAMLRSRCVFSITFEASATLMLLALCVPAVMIWRRACPPHRRSPASIRS